MSQAEIRAQVKNSLVRLYSSLETSAHDVVHDLYTIQNAIGSISVEDTGEHFRWKAGLHELTLRLEHPPRGLKPVGCSDFVARLSVELTVRSSKDPPVSAWGELVESAVGVTLEAKRAGRAHRAAWHLDTHNFAPTPDSGDVHPLLHWQHGGRAANDWEITDFGDWLISAAPRIGYPPLDFPLAVSWLLSNYAPDHWHYLRDTDRGFTTLLTEQQRWLWAPYFSAIASHWSTFPDAKRIALWPELTK